MVHNRGVIHRLGVGFLLVFALSGCRVDLLFDVSLERDGSGNVEFTLGADNELMQYIDIDELDLEGIAAEGWTMTGPTVHIDGASIVLAKRVPSAEQFDDVIAQIDMGRLISDVSIAIDIGLGSTVYDASVTIDPAMKAADFSDEELVELFGGEPFGETTAVLEERAGRPLDETITVEVTLTMPDDSVSDGEVTFAMDESVVVSGTSSFVDDELDERREAALDAQDAFDDSIKLVGVLWAIAAVVVLVLLSLGWRRRRRFFRGEGTR